MSKVTAAGHVIPALTDGPPNIEAAFTDFSDSLHGTIVAESRSELDLKAADMPAKAYPLFGWMTGDEAMMMKSSPTSSWEQIGGRGAGVMATFSNPALPAGGAYRCPFDAIERSTPGWSLSSGGATLYPPTGGLYLIYARVHLGTSGGGGLGNVYAQMHVDGVPQRSGMVNDHYISHMVMGYFQTPGAGIRMSAYHETGGEKDVKGSLIAVRLINPNWN